MCLDGQYPTTPGGRWGALFPRWVRPASESLRKIRSMARALVAHTANEIDCLAQAGKFRFAQTNDITISTDLKRNSDGLDSSVRPIGRAYGRFVNGRLTSSNYLARCMHSSDGKNRVSTIQSTYNSIIYDAWLFEVSRKIFVSQTKLSYLSDIHFRR